MKTMKFFLMVMLLSLFSETEVSMAQNICTYKPVVYENGRILADSAYLAVSDTVLHQYIVKNKNNCLCYFDAIELTVARGMRPVLILRSGLKTDDGNVDISLSLLTLKKKMKDWDKLEECRIIISHTKFDLKKAYCKDKENGLFILRLKP